MDDFPCLRGTAFQNVHFLSNKSAAAFMTKAIAPQIVCLRQHNQIRRIYDLDLAATWLISKSETYFRQPSEEYFANRRKMVGGDNLIEEDA